MTTTTIRTAATIPPSLITRKLTLLSDTGARVVLPFAPVDGTIGGLAANWQEVARDGKRPPLLIFTGAQLGTLDLEATIADTRNPLASVEHYLKSLRSLAGSSRRLWLLNYGTLVAGPWQIVDLSAAPFARQPGTNTITGFTATLSLKASSNTWAAPAPAEVYLNIAATLRDSAGGGVRPRTVTVGPTEHPSQLAARTLGTPGALGAILDANDLRDPRKILPGAVLRLP